MRFSDPHVPRRRFRSYLGLLLLGAALPACDRLQTDSTGVEMVPGVQRVLSDPSAIKLDSEGRFVLGLPVAPDDVPIITPSRAGQLAQAFLRTYGRFLRTSWEAQRGAPFRMEGLQVDHRVLFAESPYKRFPDTYHPAARRHFGPWYLVHFNSGGERALTVAVSAYATDLVIGTDGAVIEPVLGGEYFNATAVSIDGSVGPTQYVPVSPEEAAEHVARLTGSKVVEVPRLFLRDSHWHPVLAQWRVQLDRAVPLRAADGTRVMTREVFVSSKRRAAVPRAVQPNGKRVAYTTGPGARGEMPPQGTLELSRRPDVPTEFDVVSLEP